MLNNGKTFCPTEVSVIPFMIIMLTSCSDLSLPPVLSSNVYNRLRDFNLHFPCMETDNIKLCEIEISIPCSFCVSGMQNNYLHELGGIEACIIIWSLGSAWIKNKTAKGVTVMESGLKLTPKCSEFQFILSVKWLSIYRQNYTHIFMW